MLQSGQETMLRIDPDHFSHHSQEPHSEQVLYKLAPVTLINNPLDKDRVITFTYTRKRRGLKTGDDTPSAADPVLIQTLSVI